MVKSSLNGNTIYLRLLSIKGCDAIRPGLHFFYFDDKFRRIAQWGLRLKPTELYATEIIIEIKQFNPGRMASHASIESIWCTH